MIKQRWIALKLDTPPLFLYTIQKMACQWECRKILKIDDGAALRSKKQTTLLDNYKLCYYLIISIPC